MKINKILTPILAAASIGTIATPLMTLTSCNKETDKLIPVPEELMEFSQDKDMGNIFEGFKAGIDYSKYNAVVFSDDVNTTRKGSLSHLMDKNNSKIDTIVFGKNLKRINNYTFTADGNDADHCETVTKLDFSKCTFTESNLPFFGRSFRGLMSNHEGVIVTNNDMINHDTILTAALQKASLAGEWVSPNEWTHQTWTHESGNNWRYCFTPLEFDGSMTSTAAIKKYAECMEKMPSIFIDDFMYSYGNVISLGSLSSLEQSISNMSMTINNDVVLGSFTLHFVGKTISNDIVSDVNVTYNNIPLLIQTPVLWTETDIKSAIVFDVSKVGVSSWLDNASIEFEGSFAGSEVSGKINSVATFNQFKLDYEGKGLYEALYSQVEIASHYFKNLEISNE